MRFLALDFETTGLRSDSKQPLPWANYPVSVALRAVGEDRRVSQLYSSKISGATNINAWASQHHDFAPQYLNSEPDFKDVMGCAAATFAKAVALVCLNTGYGVGKELTPMCVAGGVGGAKMLDLPKVCTYKGAKASTVLDGNGLSLAELCNCVGVTQTTARTVDGDAKALAECLAAALK